MSRALELVKLAREGNASRFGDVMVAGIQEKVVAAVQAKRASLYGEGKNPFAKDDDDADEDDKDNKSPKESDDEAKDAKKAKQKGLEDEDDE